MPKSVDSLHPAVKYFLFPVLAGAAAVGIVAVIGGAGKGTVLMLKMGRVIPFAGRVALIAVPVVGAGSVLIGWQIIKKNRAEQAVQDRLNDYYYKPLREKATTVLSAQRDLGYIGYVIVKTTGLNQAGVVALLRKAEVFTEDGDQEEVEVKQPNFRLNIGGAYHYIESHSSKAPGPGLGWEFVYYNCEYEYVITAVEAHVKSEHPGILSFGIEKGSLLGPSRA